MNFINEEGLSYYTSKVTDFVDSSMLGKVCNINLLHNGWFTINQRDFGGTVTDGYGFDRWYGTYSYNSIYKMPYLLPTNYLIQPLDTQLKNALENKTVTLTVMYANNTYETGTGTYTAISTMGETILLDSENVLCSITATDTFNGGAIRIFSKQSCIIKAIKLECGSFSSIEMDVLPNVSKETLRCSTSTADVNDTYANNEISVSSISVNPGTITKSMNVWIEI